MKRRFSKVIVGLFLLFFLVGCNNVMNTPTKEVEKFLGKYQTMDNKVLEQLDGVLVSDITMTSKQKEDYKELMKKQYQNLAYKIKDEVTDGDHAEIVTEIEVYDFAKAIEESDKYLRENNNEFVLEDGTTDEEKFMDYKIKQMKDIKDKVTYTITFTLTKKDDVWTLDDVTDIDRQKIHGIYEN